MTGGLTGFEVFGQRFSGRFFQLSDHIGTQFLLAGASGWIDGVVLFHDAG